MKQRNNTSILKKVAKIYKFLALQTLNFIILLLIINLILGVLLTARSKFISNDSIKEYREKYTDLNAYSVISSAEVNHYLDEQDAMGRVGFQYAPWVQFREPEFQGDFLNTNSHGFRKSREPSRVTDSPISIFVYGGSTTFGYGVPDKYTIPSYMQMILENKYPEQSFIVQNYGQAYYYSSQEMLLLISAIKAGNIPDFVVFIDGGNDVYQLSFQHDQPEFTGNMSKLWEKGNQEVSFWNQDYSWLPMVRVGKKLLRSSRSRPSVPKDIWADRDADYVVTRYKDNVKMIRAICQIYGIQCYFVWHPVPFFKYDRSLHKTFPYRAEIPAVWNDTYSAMKDYSSPDFLYLGEFLENAAEKVFVDDVHYNEKYSEKIAMKICDFMSFDQDQ
jgi:hypothetical protein